MPKFYRELPVSASTAYAQLHAAAMGLELDRDVSHLHGSFATKQVRGTTQWYFAFREPDQRIRQIYIGPDSDEVRALVERGRVEAPIKSLKPLARSAATLGNATVQRKHLSVILRLNEFGFFRAGGVLIGTHAFLAFANQLGLHWLGSDQTADVDFAHAVRNVSIALPTNVDARPHAALTTMDEGFLPIVQYRGTAGGSYRKRDEPEFQVDFLTPQTSKTDEPIRVEHLDVALQPLRFMEFSLEQIEQATLLDPTGRCVVVSLPSPARYAVHKLLIVGERAGAYRAKIAKDLAQAASLIEYFVANDVDPLMEAWRDARARGPGWRKRTAEGLKALKLAAPDQAKHLPTTG
jgi:hypothetical protein